MKKNEVKFSFRAAKSDIERIDLTAVKVSDACWSTV